MRLVAIVLLLAGCGLPPLSSEDVFGLSPTPEVWLLGVVRDANGNTPISGATVQLAAASVTSDVNGAFRVDHLATGTTPGTVSKEGFITRTFELSLRAGANQATLTLAAPNCGSCLNGEVCDPAQGRCVATASVTGDLVDDCTGEGLSARVTVQGQSTCSIPGKGFFQLARLAPGGPHTLAAGRAGYQAYSADLTLKSGFNTVPAIRLKRVDGCGAPKPADLTCVCNTSNCQQPP